MFINKIGKDHIDYGINCQDAGTIFTTNINNFDVTKKIVCDGCGEGKHSEVGAWSFIQYFSSFNTLKYEEINNRIFKYFREISLILFKNNEDKNFSVIDAQVARDFLSFTILIALEITDPTGFREFHTITCGDGYIIKQDKEGNIEFENLDCGEFPKYCVYNFIDPDKLNAYKAGVGIDNRLVYADNDRFPKKYSKIGVASDGIRFILDAPDELKDQFIQLLKDDKEVAMKRFINKNYSYFKDDVTIAF